MNVQIDISTKPESGDGKNPKLELHFCPLAHHKLRPNSLILFDPCTERKNTERKSVTLR